MRSHAPAALSALAVLLVACMATTAEAKKKGLKHTDLICNACEVVISTIEANLKKERRRDEVTVSEKVDGICENMTYFAMTREFPRSFIKASGYEDMSAVASAEAPVKKESAPGTNSNPVKVVGVENMHDRQADNLLKRFCMQHMDVFEEQLIVALRYSAPTESIGEDLCYKHVPECTQRDEQGADLVAKTMRKPLGFRKLLRGPGWGKVLS